jgi:hypothetical protein
LKEVLCLALQQPQEVLDRASKPYCLNPPGRADGPDPPDSWKAQWVAATREWALPSLMQFINSPNVRKSAALLKYGEFVLGACPLIVKHGTYDNFLRHILSLFYIFKTYSLSF